MIATEGELSLKQNTGLWQESDRNDGIKPLSARNRQQTILRE